MTDWRWIAPAGAPIGIAGLGRWAWTAATHADPAATLRHDIRARFGVRHAALASTGRAGLTLLLRALRQLAPERGDEVVVPTYTCYSVAASIVKAGLKPRLVDVCPDTLDYSSEQLAATDFGRVLAMIATNLYGLPSDLPALTEIARSHATFLIDDAAQAMGASIGGRASGTWGDAGLFSFDKGKNVSAIDGGVILSNSDRVAEAVNREWRDLRAPSMVHSSVGILKALGYAAMLRPQLYGLPARVPRLELGKTVFSTDFSLDSPSRPLATLALSMFGSLDAFNRTRSANAARLIDATAGLRAVRFVRVHPLATAVYLRFPLLVADAATRPRILSELQRLGATGSYPASLADVPQLQPHLANPTVRADGGRYIAEHIVTLPTHPFVSPRDIGHMARVLGECLSSATAGTDAWPYVQNPEGAPR